MRSTRSPLRYALVLALLTSSISMVACGGSDSGSGPTTPPPSTTGTIAGTASLPVGAAGDAGNTRVAIYASATDWAADRVLKAVAATGSGASVSFLIADLPPGTYYLDAWKDNDNDGLFDAGDFYGVYGSGTYPNYLVTPIIVNQNQTTNVSLVIFTVTGGGGGGTPAATPSFNPPAGTYATAQPVTISSTTAGAVIHYTTDGSTPTAASATYLAPVSITASTTLRAIAIATGYAQSEVASAVYVITAGGLGGTGTVPKTGGTLTTDVADVKVPAGASLAPLDITVTPQTTPGGLPTGVVAVGKAVNVSLGAGQVQKLNAPLIIKLKYDAGAVVNKDNLAVLHHNGTKWEAATIVAEDQTARTISVEARTFSPLQLVDFTALVIPASSSVTGFAASTKGWNIPNFGSYFSPGGNCLGMSGYAVWLFSSRPSENLNGKFSATGSPSIAQLVATRAHLAQSQYWAMRSDAYLSTLGAARTARLMKFYLAALNEPLVLLLATGGSPRHASVVYGYDATGFTFYDVNVVNTAQTVSWNGTAWGTYGGYDGFSFVALPSLGRTEDFAALTTEAEGGFTSSSSLSVTSPLPGADVNDHKATLAGTVTGLTAGAKLVAYVKGVPQEIPVNGTAFSAEIPIAYGPNTIVLLAGVDMANQSNWFLNSACQILNVNGTLPPTRLLVTLTWDQNASDVDLYVTDPAGNTSWYGSHTTPSGVTLDFDNTSGYGPEHITLTEGSGSTTLPGQYVVKVHYYADHSGASTPQPITGTVTVVINEGLPNQNVSSFPFALSTANGSNDSPGSTGADWVSIASADIVNATITRP